MFSVFFSFFFFSEVVGSIAFGFQIYSPPREAVQDLSNIPKCFEVQERQLSAVAGSCQSLNIPETARGEHELG